MDTQEVYNWLRSHRHQHLCIRDLDHFSPGDVIDVAIFDRNMEEYGIWDEIPGNEPFNAAEFFRFNHHQIKWIGDGMWTLIMDGEEFDRPIHYNTESLSTHWTWVEATLDSEQKKYVIRIGDADIQVDSLHHLTRVGWRGAIMLWKHVESSKMRVLWHDPVE